MTDRQLEKMVMDFRRGMLGDNPSEYMCFAVCAPLRGYLRWLGFETKLIQGEVDCLDYNINHYWLQLPDGRIVDPTADQFLKRGTERRMPKVYIGERPDWYLVNETVNTPARDAGAQ